MARDRKRVVVVGSSFAGLAAALELKRRLGNQHDVVVVSQSDELIFTPSLVWVPFGMRDKLALSQLVRPRLAAAGISYKQAPITRFEIEQRRVITPLGAETFDYLVIATGSVPNYDAVPGLGPRGGHTQSILRWADATLARHAFERFLEAPGPVVIGGVQGASCLDLAYEFLFAMALQLERRGLSQRAPITFVTPEPHLGHLGYGSQDSTNDLARRLAEYGVEGIVDADVGRVRPDRVELDDGRSRPFAFAMLLPARIGTPAVSRCDLITNDRGLVEVDAWGRTFDFPFVFATGGAAAVTPLPLERCGPPTAGYLAEASAIAVAANIAAMIEGHPLVEVPRFGPVQPVYAEGDQTDRDRPRYREHRWLLPGPDARWAMDAFSRHFSPSPGFASRPGKAAGSDS